MRLGPFTVYANDTVRVGPFVAMRTRTFDEVGDLADRRVQRLARRARTERASAYLRGYADASSGRPPAVTLPDEGARS